MQIYDLSQVLKLSEENPTKFKSFCLSTLANHVRNKESQGWVNLKTCINFQIFDFSKNELWRKPKSIYQILKKVLESFDQYSKSL